MVYINTYIISVFSDRKWAEDQQKFVTNLNDLANKSIVVLGQLVGKIRRSETESFKT